MSANADYHSAEGISRSRLFLLSRSPQHFRYCEDNPSPPSHDLILGSAFHKLVLEPDGFGDEFAVLPDVDRRTREGKRIYEEFWNASEGKSLITMDEFSQISQMRDSVAGDPVASILLRGEVERPFFWTDSITGELCKCKPDVLAVIGSEYVIVDLKSCRSAETDTFMRDALRYGYDLQAAMYKEGVDLATGKDHRFVFIAVEKTPPYGVNIMEADDFFVNRGRHLFRQYLSVYHECRQTGNWYGYNGKEGAINNLSIPSWLITDAV